MESLKTLTCILLLSTVITISTPTQVSSHDQGHDDNENSADDDAFAMSSHDSGTTLQGLRAGVISSRNLAQKIPQNYTCNIFPRVCRMKGSPGPDCCKKKCVNVTNDGLNCGLCGLKCRYDQICCQKKCVNARFDRKNCGGCGIKCKKGDVCAYGMCSYA